MAYDPLRHHRRSIRLRGYDYTSPGAYFITLCVKDRTSVLCDIHRGDVCLNRWGAIVKQIWDILPEHFLVTLDSFVIMPDHLHGILWLTPPRTGGSRPAPTAQPLDEAGEASAPPRTGGSRPAPTAKPLGAIIGALKTMSARQINAERGTPGAPFWQRDFYERIVRDEAELERTREYIRRNPERWAARGRAS